MLALQELVPAAEAAFEPTLLGWIVLLPLVGFIINGALSLMAARRAHPPAAFAGQAHHDEPSEQEGHGDQPHPADHGDHHHGHDHAHGDAHDDAHGHDAHGHAAGPVPLSHRLPSIVAPGVMLLSFILALVNFLAMRGAHLEEPVVVRYFSWMPVGELQVDAALLLDPLSILMTLIITGVGFLIHLFSVGYMSHDPGYPRYMAYLNLFVFFMLTLVLGASYPLMFVGWE